MRKHIAILVPLLCLGLVAALLLAPDSGEAQRAGMGFTTHEISFESGGPRPTIPPDWTFQGLGNGRDAASTSLWFRDDLGNMHVLSGGFELGPDGNARFVMDRDHFILRKR